MSSDYLTFEQASALLNTPRSTLYRWLKEGRVPGHKIGRQWRFLRQELEQFRAEPQTFQPSPHTPDPLDAFHTFLAHYADTEDTMESIQQTLFWTAFDKGVRSLHLQPQPEGTWQLMSRGEAGLEQMTQLSAQAVDALMDELQEGVPPEYRNQPGVRGTWKMVRGDDHVLVMHQNVATALGTRWTFRLVRTSAKGQTLEQITRQPQDHQDLARFLSASHGLILFAGRPGSGKTTTAHTCLNELARRGDRVVFALEPSTEVLLPGVNQVSVDLNNEKAYRAAFSQIMHSDPDVLFLAST